MTHEYLPAVIIFIAAMVYTIGCVIHSHQPPRPPGIDPSKISTVCMECGRHLGGPTPNRARLVSHGICTPCKAKWESEFITHTNRW